MINNLIEKVLYKYSEMYKTYKKVSNVFNKPILKFYSCPWRKSSGLPVWRHGPIITIARNDKEYETTPGKYGNWARYTFWDEKFLETKSWWGKTWRKVIKPHYQLPTWLSFHIFNSAEYVKSKWDYYSYEYAPQFSIVFFGWSLNWYLSAPRATTDFLNKKNGISYPDDMAYWEAIYDYLYCENGSPMKNAVGSVYTGTIYTPSEEEKIDELREQRKKAMTEEERDKILKKEIKIGHKTAKCTCRPEYIKESHLEDYNKEVNALMNKNKEYKNYLWL